ncbi:hypothetical protein XANCAGTX0491_001724 [Xanthoria calcicola]
MDAPCSVGMCDFSNHVYGGSDRCSASSCPAFSLDFWHSNSCAPTLPAGNQLTCSPILHRQYAQELLSTFSTTLGEVALVPATGGIFTVDIVSPGPTSTPETNSEALSQANNEASSQLGRIQLWDRKTQGGFPEIKELKRLVRDIVEPTRDLGHVDHHGPSVKGDNQTEAVIPHQPHYQPPNQSSNAKNSVVPTTSVSLQRLTNDGGPSEPLTTAELAASRTAKKMVADIMKNFQEKVKHDGSGGRGAGSRAGVKGDGVEREAAQSEDELENKSGGSHSARQGCEDCE